MIRKIMIRKVTLLLFLFVLGACSETTSVDTVKKIDVTNLNSQNFTLENLTGQWIYVDFWASWCPPCVDALPWTHRMNEIYKEKMLFLTVNADSKAEIRDAFIKKMNISLPVVFDNGGAIMRRFSVRGLPTSIIIDPTGKIIHRQEGFMLEKQNYYEDIIRSSLGLKTTDKIKKDSWVYD